LARQCTVHVIELTKQLAGVLEFRESPDELNLGAGFSNALLVRACVRKIHAAFEADG
jgi:hypothetical protein